MVGSSTYVFGESSTTPGYRGSEVGESLRARREESSGNRVLHGSCLTLAISDLELTRHCIVYGSTPLDAAYGANTLCAILKLSR